MHQYINAIFRLYLSWGLKNNVSCVAKFLAMKYKINKKKPILSSLVSLQDTRSFHLNLKANPIAVATILMPHYKFWTQGLGSLKFYWQDVRSNFFIKAVTK